MTITQATSALTLAASASSLQLGQSLTLTASLTPTNATGSITFKDGATVLGSGTLANGTASLTTSALTIGAHNITAVYAGDTNTSSATSSAQSVTITSPPVTKTATSLVLAASSPSISVGAQLTLSAQLSPSPANGTIIFKEGASVLGTGPLTNGQASLSLTTLTSGTHILTASFTGDGTYDSATSAELRVTISPAPVQAAQQAQPISSQISLNVQPSPAPANQALKLQASINPQQATGLVTFKDGETPLGTAALVDGTAQLTTPRLGRGPHSLRADYAGAGNILPASSAPVSMMIADPAVSLTLSLSNPNPALGDQLILTARLSAQDATGTISLQQGGTHLGTSPVSMGSAQFTLRTEQAGSFVLTAAYSGDAIYAATTSAALSYSIARRLCTISLTPSTQALAQGQSVTLTVRLSPATASGQITLLEGTQALVQTNLTNGSAIFTLANLSAGAHNLQASYAGDQSCAPAISAPVTLTMARPNPVQDPKIRNLIATQTQTAMQMTQASLQVVQNRLEALHRDNVPDFVNALTAMPQSDQSSPLAFNAFAPTPLALTDPNRPLRGANTNNALTALAQISPNQTNASGASQQTGKSSPYGALIALGPRPKFWTAGTMQFGQMSLPASAGLQAQSSSHFTLSGLSAGVDQAITPQLTLGLAMSLSMNRQDLATDGSHSRARSYGLNSYASWQIAERLYLDGTLGLGRLLISSRRLDETSGAELSGARSAWLIYGSLGLSQDFVREQLTLAPYAQLTWLDARFAANEETGAPDLALRFAPAHLSQQHVSLGLRTRYDLAQNWGLLSPSLRLDYRRQLGSGFSQSISYAADPSTTYLLLDAGTDKDLFTATTGLIFQRFDHIEAALDLTLSRSRTGAHSQGLRAQARVPF